MSDEITCFDWAKTVDNLVKETTSFSDKNNNLETQRKRRLWDETLDEFASKLGFVDFPLNRSKSDMNKIPRSFLYLSK